MVHPNGNLGNELQAQMTTGAEEMTDCLRDNYSDNYRELHRENRTLREAIRQSNEALKDRYEELRSFRDRNREEKEFLMERFTEARTTVHRLNCENSNLLHRIQAFTQAADASTPVPGVAGHPPGPQSVTESPPSSYATLTETLLDADKTGEETHAQDKGEGGESEFLRLLRGRKEELEEEVARLRDALTQSQRERERDRDTHTSQQVCGEERTVACEASALTTEPQTHTATNQQDSVPDSRLLEMEEGLGKLRRELGESEERERRLRERESELLIQVTANDKQIHNLIRQLELMAEDKGGLKSQVTSLVGELQESQLSLESTRKLNLTLEDRCREAEERTREDEREAIELKKKHLVKVDELRISAHGFESALKTERQNASEGRRKLAQLQAAYHQLFIDYDGLRKQMGSYKNQHREVEDLCVQLKEAEEALVIKQELIDTLKQEAEHRKMELETIPVLAAQANVFKDDFLAERAAREKLHEQKERLQEQLSVLSLQHEDTTRAHIEELQRRHNDSLRAPPTTGNYYGGGNTSPFHPPGAELARGRSLSDEQQEFCCPKCQYLAPDIDTLQIHVMDCIQ